MRCGTIQQPDSNDWSDRNSLDMNRLERRDRLSHRKVLIEATKTIRTSIWKPRFILQSFAFTNLWQLNSIQFQELLVNSEVFKLSLNLSLAHLRAQRACYELKGDLNPVILNEIFLDSLKISKIYKDLCGKPFKRDWVTKVGFSHTNSSNFRFGGRCNRYFWDTRLKMYRFPNFNLLFQFMPTKFLKSELFSCLSKVDQVIS